LTSLGAADDEPCLRAAQQFVTAEGEEGRAPLLQRLRSQSGSCGKPQRSKSTSEPLAEILDKGGSHDRRASAAASIPASRG